MMKLIILFLVILATTCSSALSLTDPVGKFAIIQNEPSAIERRAAREFLKYSERLVGKSALKKERSTVYIGISSKIVRMLPRYARDGVRVPAKPESFVIKSLGISNGRRSLLIAGSDSPGTLYGVYHYLEYVAGCGFFRDGDYVPKLSKLPVDGIDISKSPRVKYRNIPFPSGYRSLDKFEVTYWSIPKYRQQLDWAAKRKLNIAPWNTLWYDDFAGTIPYKVFPELKRGKPEARYVAGRVRTWIWPPEYRDKWAKAILSYGRGLGIKFSYDIDWGNVPTEFADAHPEIKVAFRSTYGQSYLDTFDPACSEVTVKYLRAFADQFGSDNIYHFAPYCEESPGKNAEESVRIKAHTGMEAYKGIKRINPDSVWLQDSWDFLFGHWSKEAIKQYYSELPKDFDYFIYDPTAAEFTPPLYQSTDYFYGRDWVFSSLSSYAGDDCLHGNIYNLFNRIKEAMQDPAAGHLVGIWHNPEIIMDNVLYGDLLHRMAFDPDEFDSVDSFLDYYAKHRYGKAAYVTLRPAVGKLVEAVYNIAPMKEYIGDRVSPKFTELVNGFIPNSYYQFSYMNWGQRHAFPVNSDHEEWVPIDKERLGKMAPLMKEAIGMYLKAADVCKDNKLYENDLVDMTRTYLGMEFNLKMIDIYERFKAGDREGMERGMAKCRKTMEDLERLLSTRADFSLQRMIDDIMKVPGTNPHTPEMLKQASVWGDYPVHDCYELMHFWYRPRAETYFSLIREKMAAGRNAVSFAEIRAAFKEANLYPDKDRVSPVQFLSQDIRLPKENAYKGTPLQAVKETVRM